MGKNPRRFNFGSKALDLWFHRILWLWKCSIVFQYKFMNLEWNCPLGIKQNRWKINACVRSGDQGSPEPWSLMCFFSIKFRSNFEQDLLQLRETEKKIVSKIKEPWIRFFKKPFIFLYKTSRSKSEWGVRSALRYTVPTAAPRLLWLGLFWKAGQLELTAA